MFDETIRRAIQIATMFLSVALVIELSVALWRKPRHRLILIPVLFLVVHFLAFYSTVMYCDRHICEPHIFLADWSSILRFNSMVTLCVLVWDKLNARSY